MKIPDFSISAIPGIVFGDGMRRRLPELAKSFGHSVLLVTGAASFQRSPAWPELLVGLQQRGVTFEHMTVSGEPSPQLVDEAARRFRSAAIDVVIGIGGGSVLDAAKAIAGLLRVENSVMDFLEGVGPELPYQGPAVPFIAVPTTAGTGSEATKNAVLSQQGEGGFKKSFRHDTLVARYAVLDPELLSTCPAALVAADGMDAFTQLLESYVSTRANPFTDALAMSGIRAVRDSLVGWYRQEGDVAEHRANMAYAALLSGITLAQVGLGSVHGLAAPLGAFFPIPHGVVCGTLVAECTRANIHLLQTREPDSPALWRYAHVGKVLANDMKLDEQQGLDVLVQVLEDWTQQMGLARLGEYGMEAGDIAHVVENCRGSSMKTNPLVLTDDEVAAILQARL
ncbi:MAG: alcohol dehydrogenase [Betaproteobacteria bacterium HGW-Betaproteobacteria-1]|jgi:alcohol dehydrogenase|nr:MAG: alcohol dehydrogenase [Betaproteobacteria bacterium HGW-Betaproteobacteria-1]